jgi:hypothetical protein
VRRRQQHLDPLGTCGARVPVTGYGQKVSFCDLCPARRSNPPPYSGKTNKTPFRFDLAPAQHLGDKGYLTKKAILRGQTMDDEGEDPPSGVEPSDEAKPLCLVASPSQSQDLLFGLS